MQRLIATFLLTILSGLPLAQAEEFVIDTEKAHAFIQFRIQHLGFSWIYGRFNNFSGDFSYDENNPSAAKINVTIDVASIDTNHAERDKHLRKDEFLDVKKYPEANFSSTSFTETGDGKAVMQGDFTLHGVTRPITINVEHVGHGDDPWGGYRRGFYGATSFRPADYGIDMSKLGPSAGEIFLELSLEGIRQ